MTAQRRPPQIVLVAAVGRNGVIGVDGRLPWRIPEDLEHFKRLTMGHALIMGRATFDSIGRPLPGRMNIVLTRNPSWAHDGVRVAASLEQAIEMAGAEGLDAFVSGGAEVYRAALPLADRLELTEVDAAPSGDTRFPEVDWSQWRETSRISHDGFSFVTHERIRARPGE